MKKILSGVTALIFSISFGGTAVFAQENSAPLPEEDLIAEQKPADPDDLPIIKNDDECCFTGELLEELEKQPQDSDIISLASNEMIFRMWDKHGSENSDHALIIEDVMTVLRSDMSQKKKATIKQCLIYGSYKADTSDMHNSSKGITQLHAQGNYVANLKAVWKYSKLIYSHSDEYCRSHIKNSMPNLTKNEKEQLDTLLKTIPNIYKHYKNKYGHAPSKLEKKYLVMGLAIHLIGDIYAHRTIVPVYYADTPNTYFKPAHFINYPAFIDDVKRGNLRTSKITSYLKEDLPRTRNLYYEDNTDFIPNRYVYSTETSKNFVSQILISGNNFSAEYLLQSEDNDIRLYGFSSYAERAGA